MASSTSNLDLIQQSQASKEVTANALFDAGSPATVYGRRESTTTGLTWGYYGGTIRNNAGALTVIANGTLALTASATNYIEASPSDGTVSKNTSGFTSGRIPLYTVVAGTATVTSYTDHRTVSNQAIVMASGRVLIGTTTDDGINKLQVSGPIVATNLLAGVYTPTATAISNVDAVTTYPCQYMRVGDVVTVSGAIDIDATATGFTELRITLPIASNFADVYQAGGMFCAQTSSGVARESGAILADAANDALRFRFTSSVTANAKYTFSATYRII